MEEKDGALTKLRTQLIQNNLEQTLSSAVDHDDNEATASIMSLNITETRENRRNLAVKRSVLRSELAEISASTQHTTNVTTSSGQQSFSRKTNSTEKAIANCNNVDASNWSRRYVDSSRSPKSASIQPSSATDNSSGCVVQIDTEKHQTIKIIGIITIS